MTDKKSNKKNLFWFVYLVPTEIHRSIKLVDVSVEIKNTRKFFFHLKTCNENKENS